MQLRLLQYLGNDTLSHWNSIPKTLFNTSYPPKPGKNYYVGKIRFYQNPLLSSNFIKVLCIKHGQICCSGLRSFLQTKHQHLCLIWHLYITYACFYMVLLVFSSSIYVKIFTRQVQYCYIAKCLRWGNRNDFLLNINSLDWSKYVGRLGLNWGQTF